MNIFLYYSKKNIPSINSVVYVKKRVKECFLRIFRLLDEAEETTISISPAKFNQILDIYIICDTMPASDMSDVARGMDQLKKDVKGIIQQDQNTDTEYIIRTKIKEDYYQELSEPKSADVENVSVDAGKKLSEIDYDERAKNYIPVEPSYSFERVILPDDVISRLEDAVSVLEFEDKVFREWGLYEIQPHPSTALSFFGPSGTGKTMAAEALACKLGRKILKVSYADVESKYHGEGPKMVKAIFLAAENNNAVLFFDEADSLLSKRLTNVSQGSEQAINSMRSQLLICLEEFRGIVIFATNLVVNYDQAFLTRLISIEFHKPDVMTRKKIWDVHIFPTNEGIHKLNIPLTDDVDTGFLAEKYDFSGREIRNAVISACVRTAKDGRAFVSQDDFIIAADQIVKEIESIRNAKDHTEVKASSINGLNEAISKQIKERDARKVSSLVDE